MKSEQKKMIYEAEAKKKAVRRTIEDMREKFRSLLDRNMALPAHVRIFRKVRQLRPISQSYPTLERRKFWSTLF